MHGLAADGATCARTLGGRQIKESLVGDGFDEAVAESVERDAECTNGFRSADAFLSLSLREGVGLC
jgi:hypothetical protein